MARSNVALVGDFLGEEARADGASVDEFGDSVAELRVGGFDGSRVAQHLDHGDFDRREAKLSSFGGTEPKTHSRHRVGNLSRYGDLDDARNLSRQPQQMRGRDTSARPRFAAGIVPPAQRLRRLRPRRRVSSPLSVRRLSADSRCCERWSHLQTRRAAGW